MTFDLTDTEKKILVSLKATTAKERKAKERLKKKIDNLDIELEKFLSNIAFVLWKRGYYNLKTLMNNDEFINEEKITSVSKILAKFLIDSEIHSWQLRAALHERMEEMKWEAKFVKQKIKKIKKQQKLMKKQSPDKKSYEEKRLAYIKKIPKMKIPLKEKIIELIWASGIPVRSEYVSDNLRINKTYATRLMKKMQNNNYLRLTKFTKKDSTEENEGYALTREGMRKYGKYLLRRAK